MLIAESDYAIQRRQRLVNAVNEYMTSDDVTVEEMADIIHGEVEESIQYFDMMHKRSLQASVQLAQKETGKIHLSYKREDTKQNHEFGFSSWEAALAFAKLVDRSDETKLLELKVSSE